MQHNGSLIILLQGGDCKQTSAITAMSEYLSLRFIIFCQMFCLVLFGLNDYTNWLPKKCKWTLRSEAIDISLPIGLIKIVPKRNDSGFCEDVSFCAAPVLTVEHFRDADAA